MELISNGLYTINEQFFLDYPNPKFMDNKRGKRPYFFAIKDMNGLYWMVPMSTQVDTYKLKIEKEEKKRGKGNCIFYHIGVIAGTERAFSIGDMFPITDTYINNPFTISGIHYIIKDKTLVRELYSKSMRFLKLVESRTIHTTIDIMKIKGCLLAKSLKKK